MELRTAMLIFISKLNCFSIQLRILICGDVRVGMSMYCL